MLFHSIVISVTCSSTGHPSSKGGEKNKHTDKDAITADI